MLRKLTQQDIDILQTYQIKGQCDRYWKYLANLGERYAALSPGVVFDENDDDAPLRHFYWTQYRSASGGKPDNIERSRFGHALMRVDIAQRSVLLQAGEKKAALHLSVSHIYLQHKRVLRHKNSWTPMQILQPFNDSPNPNINVAQKIWDSFIEMADIYADQTTLAEILGSISLFQAHLFWLAKQDPRALNERVMRWIELDILPVMMAAAMDAEPDSSSGQ